MHEALLAASLAGWVDVEQAPHRGSTPGLMPAAVCTLRRQLSASRPAGTLHWNSGRACSLLNCTPCPSLSPSCCTSLLGGAHTTLLLYKLQTKCDACVGTGNRKKRAEGRRQRNCWACVAKRAGTQSWGGEVQRAAATKQGGGGDIGTNTSAGVYGVCVWQMRGSGSMCASAFYRGGCCLAPLQVGNWPQGLLHRQGSASYCLPACLSQAQ